MTENKHSILVYYHEDADGKCCAAQVGQMAAIAGSEVKYIAVQHNSSAWYPEDVVRADSVFVLGFTFSDMEAFAEIAGEKLVWIDHHKSTEEQHYDLWHSNVRGTRDISKAASELVFRYTVGKSKMPTAVEYIARRDIWNFGDKREEITAFMEAFKIFLHSPENPDWKDLLALQNKGKEKVEFYLKVGRALVEAQKIRTEAAFESGLDLNFYGFRARLINATADISEIGEFVYLKIEYDIAVIWQVEGDMIRVSLRSNSVDCAEIAKKYNGGGHSGAAEFFIPVGGVLSPLIYFEAIQQI